MSGKQVKYKATLGHEWENSGVAELSTQIESYHWKSDTTMAGFVQVQNKM